MNQPIVSLEPSRICIITPGHLSTNPRLVKEADALADAGYDVKVIAADFVNWAREADSIFLNRPWSVVRKLPFGPDAPLSVRAIQLARQHLARILVTLRLDPSAVVRAASHPIGPDLVAAALRIPADLYIAHYPAALPAAAMAARRYGALYAFDAEDFHLGDYPKSPQYSVERRMVHAIERRHLSGCAYVTASSPGIADAYAKTYMIMRPTVILNVFPLPQAPSGPTTAGSVIPGPSVYWFSQTIGPHRGLENAVRAIGRSRSRPHLYVRGTPARGFVDRLQTIAAEVGIADCVHVLPPALPSDMERLAATYDMGLVSETDYLPSRQIALTNKLFSYLLAGMPVAMSNIPAHQTFVRETGIATSLYAADDADGLASVLDAFLGDPTMLAAARAAAFHLGQTRFNWEMERSTLLNRVRISLGAKPTDVVRSTCTVKGA